MARTFQDKEPPLKVFCSTSCLATGHPMMVCIIVKSVNIYTGGNAHGKNTTVVMCRYNSYNVYDMIVLVILLVDNRFNNCAYQSVICCNEPLAIADSSQIPAPALPCTIIQKSEIHLQELQVIGALERSKTWPLPSGKHTKNYGQPAFLMGKSHCKYGKSPCLMGKLTTNMDNHHV